MTEDIDYKILSIYIVFGFFILLGYIMMIEKYSKNSDLWSNKNKNMILKSKGYGIKYVYCIMILFSFLSGIYLLYYLSTTPKNTDNEEIIIYVGLVLFLVCSTVWAFFPFEYNRIILGLVAIGAILILVGIVLNSDDPTNPIKAVALTASSILVIQTFFFDFLIWTGILNEIFNNLL